MSKHSIVRNKKIDGPLIAAIPSLVGVNADGDMILALCCPCCPCRHEPPCWRMTFVLPPAAFEHLPAAMAEALAAYKVATN